MLLLVARRSTEKTLSSYIPSSSLAWLQQATALPFMAAMLPFATWYNVFNLSRTFLLILILYACIAAVDLILYYKALQIGDISLIAPLINLTSVTSILGSFIILKQTPTLLGIIAAGLVMCGAYFVAKHRNKHSTTAHNNSLAILLILIIVLLRGIYAPIEVFMLRETNAIYLNFISSLLTVPVILLVVQVQRLYTNKKIRIHKRHTGQTIINHKLALAFIGLTMALNLFFTLSARTLAPNAGYVTAIKGAQVVPMTLIGLFLFKETVTPRQWSGIALIVLGLVGFLFT